jgi:short subunit dehydrogenase-like uncharacterized protein
MYYQGESVTQNYLLAYMSMILAGRDNKRAADLRNEIAESMEQAQVIQPQEMARKCEAQHFKKCE